jgi:hypothetical protein
MLADLCFVCFGRANILVFPQAAEAEVRSQPWYGYDQVSLDKSLKPPRPLRGRKSALRKVAKTSSATARPLPLVADRRSGRGIQVSHLPAPAGAKLLALFTASNRCSLHCKELRMPDHNQTIHSHSLKPRRRRPLHTQVFTPIWGFTAPVGGRAPSRVHNFILYGSRRSFSCMAVTQLSVCMCLISGVLYMYSCSRWCRLRVACIHNEINIISPI